jgi:hypothetical protein
MNDVNGIVSTSPIGARGRSRGRRLSSELLGIALVFMSLVVAAEARAELQLAIELGADTIRPNAPVAPAFGPELDVRLIVSNTSAFELSNVAVVVPLGTQYLTITRPSIIGGSCNSLIGNVNNCNNPESISFPIGDLPPGGGRTVGFALFVAALADGTEVTISATATATGASVVASETVVVRAEPAFELALAPDSNPVGAGDDLAYTLSWGHVATARLAPAAHLRFELPEGTNFVSASHGGTLDGRTVRWELGDLGPGESGERRVELTVDAGLVEGTLLVARAELSDAAGALEIARAPSVIRVENAVPLELALTLGPDPLRTGIVVDGVPGRTLDVWLTATNRGAFELPEVEIILPLEVRFESLASRSIVGGACDSLIGNVLGCDFPERAIFPVGPLAPGEGRTVGFQVFVRQLPEGSVVGIDAFASSAAANVWVVAEGNALARTDPDYELSLLADRQPVGAGEELEYTLVWGFVEKGRIAPGAMLAFDIPKGAEFLSATSGGVVDGGVVSWALGDLGPGASGTRSVRVIVDAALPEGTILESRAEIADSGLPNEAARADDATRIENAIPLRLAFEFGPDPLRSGLPSPGVLGRFSDVRLTISNQGDFVLPDVGIRMPIPARFDTFASPSIIEARCDSLIGNVNNCDFPESVDFAIGDLEPGSGRTVGFSAFSRVFQDGSVLTLDAFATSSAAKIQVVGERSIVLRSAPAFELAVAADRDPVGAGEGLEYTLTWGHVASARLAEGTVLNFELPPGTSFVSATHGGTFTGGIVRWELGDVGPLRGGERRVTVSIDASLDEGELLIAQAEIADATAVPERARARAVTRIEDDSPLDLDVDISPDPVLAGGAFTVSLTLRNLGAVEMPGVRIDVPIPERITTLNRLSIIGGTCDSLVGNVNNCNIPERVIFDIGTLPAGETRNLSFAPSLISGATALVDGSLIRFSAFLSSATQHGIVVRDLRVGEEEVAPRGRFVRGDANADGAIDIADPISTLSYLFLGGTTPTCLDAADGDDSSKVDISDPILILSFLFLGGVEPAPPTGRGAAACGEDPTPDDGVSCDAFAPCDA